MNCPCPKDNHSRVPPAWLSGSPTPSQPQRVCSVPPGLCSGSQIPSRPQRTESVFSTSCSAQLSPIPSQPQSVCSVPPAQWKSSSLSTTENVQYCTIFLSRSAPLNLLCLTGGFASSLSGSTFRRM